MRRGPQKQPTALKIANGNPGHRPLPENEPEVVIELLEPPESLDDEEAAQWKVYAAKYFAIKVLAETDREALELLTKHTLRYRRATKKVAKDGEIIGTPQGPKRNPWAIAAEKAGADMLRLLDRFGGSPSTRTGVTTTGKKDSSGKLKVMFE